MKTYYLLVALAAGLAAIAISQRQQSEPRAPDRVPEAAPEVEAEALFI